MLCYAMRLLLLLLLLEKMAKGNYKGAAGNVLTEKKK